MARKALRELLLRGGTVVTAEDQFEADVHVVGEKIARIGRGLGSKLKVAPEAVIDATGCYLFPGGVDPHVHMALPVKGGFSSDSFESGSIAALHGGTTTIIDFANQVPGGTIRAALGEWFKRADGFSACDYAFHVSVTDFNEKTRKELRECVEKHGITSFKTFMAYKGAMMIDDRQMIEVMEEVKRLGGIVLTHAENGDMIQYLIEKHRAEGKRAPKYHAASRPQLAEAEACSRIVDLAALTGCPLYIVHLSSEAALERVRAAATRNAAGSPIFVETCIQYLLLDDSAYEKPGFEGAKYVLSPPLRKPSDQTALWKGLAANVVETVATDHCPFTMKQRQAGREDFSKIPNGLPGVEHRLELLYSEGVEKGRISLQQFVALTSTSPARIFGLYPQKGVIAEGADADIVVFDPKVEHLLGLANQHMNCDYSVYEGWKVRGKCRTVFLRGTVAVDQGQLRVGAGFGQYLRRKGFEKLTT